MDTGTPQPPGTTSPNVPPTTTDPPHTPGEPSHTTRESPTTNPIVTTTTTTIPTTTVDPITTTTTTIDRTTTNQIATTIDTTTTRDPLTTTTTTEAATTATTRNPWTTRTPYTTRYVTTETIITVTTQVPETTRISGSVTTVYVNRTATTRVPTIIQDPTQEPPPPSSETHGDGSGLQTWQLTLIVVASLVVCLAVGAVVLVSWIRKKKLRSNIPFTKLDLRSAGLETWDDDRRFNKGSGTGTATVSQRGSSPGGSSPGRTVTARAMPASGMGDYEHGPYLEVYDPGQGPIALRSLNEDMQHYEQYTDWPERPSEELYGYPRFLREDDEYTGHVAPAMYPYAGPSRVSYPAPPRPSSSTSRGTSPTSPALHPLLEGRVSESTDYTDGHTHERSQSSGFQREHSSDQRSVELGSHRESQDGTIQTGDVTSPDVTRSSVEGINNGATLASSSSVMSSEPSTSETGPLSARTTLIVDPEQLEQNSKYEHFRQGPQALLSLRRQSRMLQEGGEETLVESEQPSSANPDTIATTTTPSA
ncbi:hypothetical protein MVEG_02239 [Podila verticillata NRRL 6337]|nr:hypothetical protein MVEG_02239 [Podila verticillata NRRL 6337]